MIAGVFEDPRDGAKATDELINQGVSAERISVVTTEPTAKRAFAIESQTKGAEGVAVGGSIGAATGAILAGLTTVGAVATGGVGILVAGPLVAAFTGAGVGGVTGGIVGGLVGLGFDEEEVQGIEEALDKGSLVVTVDMKEADDEQQVREILESHHTREVATA
jgi:hypothetical protein